MAILVPVSLPFLRILVTFTYRFKALEKVKSWRNTNEYLTTKCQKRGDERTILQCRKQRLGIMRQQDVHAMHWLYHASTYAIRGTTKVVDIS